MIWTNRAGPVRGRKAEKGGYRRLHSNLMSPQVAQDTFHSATGALVLNRSYEAVQGSSRHLRAFELENILCTIGLIFYLSELRLPFVKR